MALVDNFISNVHRQNTSHHSGRGHLIQWWRGGEKMFNTPHWSEKNNYFPQVMVTKFSAPDSICKYSGPFHVVPIVCSLTWQDRFFLFHWNMYQNSTHLWTYVYIMFPQLYSLQSFPIHLNTRWQNTHELQHDNRVDGNHNQIWELLCFIIRLPFNNWSTEAWPCFYASWHAVPLHILSNPPMLFPSLTKSPHFLIMPTSECHLSGLFIKDKQLACLPCSCTSNAIHADSDQRFIKISRHQTCPN